MKFSSFCADENGVREPDSITCPYGKPGDRLWVKETFSQERCVVRAYPDAEDDFISIWRDIGLVIYHADMNTNSGKKANSYSMAIRPSIHMPRWASRILLEITDVRVERLWSITNDDAISEGVEALPSGLWRSSPCITSICCSARGSFVALWNSLYEHRPMCAWNDNPWVWVVTFKRV